MYGMRVGGIGQYDLSPVQCYPDSITYFEDFVKDYFCVLYQEVIPSIDDRPSSISIVFSAVPSTMNVNPLLLFVPVRNNT